MKYGLVGESLAHTYSPGLHALLAPYEYVSTEISPDSFAEFMRNRDFVGINVTIPYKAAVLPYLDESDESVTLTGAANTVVNRDGSLIGYNTDLYGLLSLIRRCRFDLKNKKILICGSGGTSLTARAACLSLGASEVYRISRNDKADISYDEAYTTHCDADVIINATPAGMFPDTGSRAIDVTRFNHLSAVIDAVYNPLRSRLVCDAMSMNIPASGGLFMLVAQAASSSAIFTGAKCDDRTVRRVYGKLRRAKENIVLIGMPGCGKSAVGRILAGKTGRTLYDTDRIVTELSGQSPAAIIRSDGEAAFRKLEAEVIRKLETVSGAIIATGGGTVTDNANITLLRQYGRIFFIDRPPELLIPTSDRPLMRSADDVMRLYSERIGLYRASADIIISAAGTISDTASKITEEFLK